MQSGPFTVELGEILQANPALAKDPLTALHASDNMASHAVLPIPFGQPEAVLTLASTTPHFYQAGEDDMSDAEDGKPQLPFDALLALRLEPLLTRCCAARNGRRRRRCGRWRRRSTPPAA